MRGLLLVVLPPDKAPTETIGPSDFGTFVTAGCVALLVLCACADSHEGTPTQPDEPDPATSCWEMRQRYTWREVDGGTCGDYDALMASVTLCTSKRDAPPGCRGGGVNQCDGDSRWEWWLDVEDDGELIGEAVVTTSDCASTYELVVASR